MGCNPEKITVVAYIYAYIHFIKLTFHQKERVPVPSIFRVQTSSEFQGGVTVSQPFSCHMAQSFTNLDFPEKKTCGPISIHFPSKKLANLQGKSVVFSVGGKIKNLGAPKGGLAIVGGTHSILVQQVAVGNSPFWNTGCTKKKSKSNRP